MASTPIASEAAERPAPPPAPVSFEAFLAWAPEDAQVEWIDGEILTMSPASTEHQRLLGFIFAL